MSENQNQDFEKLQHLLKLKRYEQPHPRYFNELSGRVTSQLHAADSGRLHSFEEAVTQSPWLERLWAVIEGRPALSGVVMAGMCGVILVGGFLTGEPMQPGQVANELEKKPLNVSNQSLLAATPAGAVTFSSSTNPTATMPNSLFNIAPNLQTMPTSGRSISQ